MGMGTLGSGQRRASILRALGTWSRWTRTFFRGESRAEFEGRDFRACETSARMRQLLTEYRREGATLTGAWEGSRRRRKALISLIWNCRAGLE